MINYTGKKVLVVSDTHLGHKNIVRYTGRPVNCDEVMFRAFQQRRDAEHIIHVGDFSTWYKVSEEQAREWFDKMFFNIKPTLIRGNHDRDDSPTMLLPWGEVIEDPDQPYMIEYEGLRIGFKHWPYDKKGSDWRQPIEERRDYNLLAGLDIAIHGHIHEKGHRYEWVGEWGGTLIVNACVEHWDFRPIDLDEIVAQYYAWRQYNKEGHGRRRK